jgi:hypothetical protein
MTMNMPIRTSCLGILILALLASGPAFTQSVGHHARNDASAAESSRKPSRNAKPNDLVPIQDAVNRVASALETANKKQPSKQDEDYSRRNVEAQESLVFWAPFMFGVGVVETLVTLVGVIFVWRTLKAAWATKTEAERAANEAKRQADISEKTFTNLEAPYIYPTALRYFTEGASVSQTASGQKHYIFTRSNGGLCIAAKARNYGRAPARMLSAKLRFLVHDADEVRAAIFSTEEVFEFNYMLAEKDTSDEFKLGPLPEATAHMVDIDNGKKFLTLAVYLRYEDVFGNEGGNGSSYYWDPKRNDFVYGAPPFKQNGSPPNKA